MINPITSDTDEFLHWYLITPMDNSIGYPLSPIIDRLIRTVQNPPEWNSIHTTYNRCINFINFKSYMDNK